jgi:flagellar basal body-associated protein FliL
MVNNIIYIYLQIRDADPFRVKAGENFLKKEIKKNNFSIFILKKA